MLRCLLVGAALLATSLAHAEPTELSAADTARLVGFFEKLLDAMVANKADCTKMARAIDGLATSNAPMLRDVLKQLADGRTLPKAAETRLAERMAKHEQDLSACVTNEAVNHAMRRIDNPELPAGPPPEVLAEVKAPVAEDLATYTKKLTGKGELIATIKVPQGTVRCRLFADKAPMTVANFVGLATGQKPWLDPKTNTLQRNKPYYDGTIFHRVIPDFMIQGGDPTGTGMGGPGYKFGDEDSGEKMAPGVLAMANAGPATNGSQFFITESAPSYLDGKHTIFGTCKPLSVVKKIARVKRDAMDRPAKASKMKVTISRGAL